MTSGLASPLAAATAMWRLVAACTTIGVLVGLALGLARQPVHTAQARLNVGQVSASANAVPGYALAAQQLAESYSRLLSSDAVQERLLAEVPSEAPPAVNASPIPGSSIILVEATAGDSEAARSGAEVAAGALVDLVDQMLRQNNSASVEQAYREATAELVRAEEALAAASASDPDARAEAEAAVRLARLRSDALAQAVSSAVAQPANDVEIVNSARVVGNDRVSRLQLLVFVLGVGGACMGILLAFLLSAWASRKATTGPRPHGETDNPSDSRYAGQSV